MSWRATCACPRSRAALSYRSTPCAAPSRSLDPRRRPGAPHRGLSHHQNPWRRCCCPWEECGPAPASARERTRRASGAVVAALFWGSRAAPDGRYCDGLSHNNLALIVRVANPQPPLRGRPSLRHRRGRPRRARLARCQGSFLLWTGSAKTRLRRAASREAARIRPERLPEKAVGASDPAVGRSTHTRGTACLPRAALPNKGAPRP